MEKSYSIFSKIIIIIIIFALVFYSISSYNISKSIDKLAYVVGLGIDEGKNNNIKLSIQLAKPSSSSSSSSSQSSTTVIDSVECSSIDTGLNLFNSYISRDLNLSHCDIIAISEKVAAKGINNYIYTLTNNVEVSSHANILITKCEANEYLEKTNPVLEDYPARYYEIVNISNKITGYTKANSLTDFFSNEMDKTREPVTVLSNINNDKTHQNEISNSFINKDSSYIARSNSNQIKQ